MTWKDRSHSATGTTTLIPSPEVQDFSYEPVKVGEVDATEVRITLDHAPGEDEYYGIQIHASTHLQYLDGSDSTYFSYHTPGYVLTAADTGSFDLEDFIQVNYNWDILGTTNDYRPLTLVTRKQFEGATYKFYIDSFDSGILDSIRENMPDGETGMAGGGIVSGDVGSQLPGEMDLSRVPVHSTAHYFITFYRLSQEAYLYTKTLYQSNFDFLSNMGLTPANFSWTNVQNGLGFVGCIRPGRGLGPVVIEKDIPVGPEKNKPIISK